MKKQLFAKFARKSVATIAAAALALSMLGLAGCGTAQRVADDAAPLADGEATVTTTDAAPAQDAALVIKAGPAKEGTPAGTYTWPELTVTAKDPNKKIMSITVQFTSEISKTDEITFTDSGDFKVFDVNKHGNKSVNNAKGATAEEWQKYIRENMKITLSSSNAAKSLRMIASFEKVEATYDFNSANGHYYKYVKVEPPASNQTSISWSDALKAAEADSYLGLQGYLVTVTSADEMKFITSLVNARTWLGGTCWPTYTAGMNGAGTAISQKKYFWVSGPEKGTAISTGSTPASGAYTNWSSGEPNNCTGIGKDKKGGSDLGEYCLHMYDGSGLWNDYPNFPDSGSHYVHGYVIEYGGMPQDDDVDPSVDVNVDVEVDVKVDIKLDPTGHTMTVDVNDVYVGQPLSVSENVNGGDVMTKKDGTDVPAEITRTYEKLGADGKTWTALPAGQLPTHAGTYRVTSAAAYSITGTTSAPYASDPATFKIKPKVLIPEFTKVYDGTTDLDATAAGLADIKVSDMTLENADVKMTATAATFNAPTVSGAKEVYLTGATLTGTDAADYALPPMKDGKNVAKGTITPRELELTAIAPVNWGLEGNALKKGDATVAATDYKTDLAVHGTGEWAKNELASRDAKADLSETILGALTFTKFCGTTALDEANPVRGLYAVEPHFANVNPASASAADNDKGGSALAIMSEEGEVQTQTEVQPNAAPPATAPSALDTITVTKTDDGRYNIGNYILKLNSDKVLITDNPLNEDGYDDATKFLSDTHNEKVDPEAKPLTQDELLDLVKELFKGDLPEGTPTLMITDKDGKPVTTIDPTKVGSYAIVATYPNPDGEDTVVRVNYNVLQNDPIVEKQAISVRAHEGAEPMTKDGLKKIVENIMDGWVPEGVNPTVVIADKDGKQVSDIPMDKPGEYKVTLTYIDDNGVVRQVELDYKVDPDQIEEVKEDIRKPTHEGEPMTKQDVIDDIVERYTPDIIPADAKDFEVTITGPDGTEVDKIDPSVPGTYTVVMTYTDAEGNEHKVKTTYTFFEPDDGIDRQAQGTDPSTDDGTGSGDGDDNGMNRQAQGTDPSTGSNGTGSDFNSGASGYKGWDNNSGSKGFADRFLAQTGDPVFWVICGVVVVAVVAGVVLIVARKKNKKQQ